MLNELWHFLGACCYNARDRKGGRKAWKEQSNYHAVRWRKRLCFGTKPSLVVRSVRAALTTKQQNYIQCAALNRMIQAGQPDRDRVEA